MSVRILSLAFNLERLIRTFTNSSWNVSKLNSEKIPDLEGFKPFFDGFELTPSFALDTTGASLIQK
jgi:hypothetical protein